eukprot:910419-Amphidinium_carterae.1
MCDQPSDFDRLKEFFATIDKAHGVPDDRLIPTQVKVDWYRWAHEKTMNAGYEARDSHKWLLERELEWETITPGPPPSVLRQQFDSPDGVFPQNWPAPDEDVSEAQRESHIVAALIMDDYDNRVPTHE